MEMKQMSGLERYCILYKFCRKRPGRKGKYVVNGRKYQNSIQDDKGTMSLRKFSEVNGEDCEEPMLINGIKLLEDSLINK